MKNLYLLTVLLMSALIVSCSEEDIALETAPADSVYTELGNTSWFTMDNSEICEVYFSPTGAQMTERITYRVTGSVKSRVADLTSFDGNIAEFAIRSTSDDVNDGLNATMTCEIINENRITRELEGVTWNLYKVAKTITCETGSVLTLESLGVPSGSTVTSPTPLLFNPQSNGMLTLADGIGYLIINRSTDNPYVVKVVIGTVLLQDNFQIPPYYYYLGYTIEEFKGRFGSDYLTLEDNLIEYIRQIGDPGFIQNVIYYYKYPYMGSELTQLALVLDNDVYDKVKEYLQEKYTYYTTDSGLDYYTEGETVGKSSYGITHGYTDNRHMLAYVPFDTTSLFDDYSVYGGWTLDEIVNKFGEPIYKDENLLYYHQYGGDGDYVKNVYFYYNQDYKVREISVDLNKTEGIEDFLYRLYPVYNGYNSENKDFCFLFADLEIEPNVWVYYYPTLSTIMYVFPKINQNKPVDLTSLIGRDYSEALFTLGEPVSEDSANRTLTYTYDDDASLLTLTYNQYQNKIEDIVLDTYNSNRVNHMLDISSYYCYETSNPTEVGDSYENYYDDENDPQIKVRYGKAVVSAGTHYTIEISSTWRELGYIYYNDGFALEKSFPGDNFNPSPYRLMSGFSENTKTLRKIHKPFMETGEFDIVIDITEPEFVSVSEQYTGWGYSDNPVTIMTANQYYMNYDGYSESYLKELQQMGYYDLYGVISYNKITFNYKSLILHWDEEANSKFIFVYNTDGSEIDLTIVDLPASTQAKLKRQNNRREA